MMGSHGAVSNGNSSAAGTLGENRGKVQNFLFHCSLCTKAYFDDAGPTAFGGFNLLGVAAAAASAVGHHHQGHHHHHHSGAASFAVPHEDYPYS